jgi:hypothetical protein
MYCMGTAPDYQLLYVWMKDGGWMEGVTRFLVFLLLLQFFFTPHIGCVSGLSAAILFCWMLDGVTIV